MEIHSAAKLPTFHFRPEAGTGARSALKSLLSCTSANWLGLSSPSGSYMGLNDHRAIYGYNTRENQVSRKAWVHLGTATDLLPHPGPLPSDGRGGGRARLR